MAVFRIEKTKNYTVMSNYHLKDRKLSLKAKGLLSMMLSLPEEWNYTTRGLASICKEGVDSIGTALKELECAGYIKRSRLRNKKGKIIDTEYLIFENPQSEEDEEPYTEYPYTEYPYTGFPYMDIPRPDESDTENPAQLNTNRINTNKSKTDLSNTYPIKSYQSESMGYDEMKKYGEVIKENIEYEFLSVAFKEDKQMLDEIVDLLTETVCTAKKCVVIANDTYPAESVRQKLLRLNSEHIKYVMECMMENTARVKNIKKYLLAMLFNAPSTMDSYYRAKVNADLYAQN